MDNGGAEFDVLVHRSTILGVQFQNWMVISLAIVAFWLVYLWIAYRNVD